MIKINAVGVAAYPAGASFGPRTMRDYEFVWVMRGSGLAQYDQHRIQAGPDSLLLCRPGITDRYDWDPGSRTVHAYLHFNLGKNVRTKAWPFHRQMAKDDLLKSLFQFCLRTKEPKLVRESLQLMLNIFIGGDSRLQTQHEEPFPPALEKAVDFVRSRLNLAEPDYPTPTAIASASYVSVEHLSRLFKRHLNLGPAEYVRLLRLDRAATLLSRSNLNVTEIAEAVRFSSPFHFSKAFKAAYGLSPAHYRTASLQGKLSGVNPAVNLLRNLSAI